jgi:hypothetical protein
MKCDIRRLALWLEKVCQEGIAIEHKILDWKIAEEKQGVSVPVSKRANCCRHLRWLLARTALVSQR